MSKRKVHNTVVIKATEIEDWEGFRQHVTIMLSKIKISYLVCHACGWVDLEGDHENLFRRGEYCVDCGDIFCEVCIDFSDADETQDNEYVCESCNKERKEKIKKI
jgi:hypothetical protein